MEEQNFLESLYQGTIFQDGYGQISRSVMRDKNISRDAKALYSYLMSFAGNKMSAFPGRETICKELGFKSKDTYYKYLNELKVKGLINVRQEMNGTKFANNIYTIALKNEQITQFAEDYQKRNNEDPDSKDSGDKKPCTNFSGHGNFGTRKIWDTNNNIFLNKEEKETVTEIFNFYSTCKNAIVSEAEQVSILQLVKEYSSDLVLKAMQLMLDNANKTTISYLKSTLKDWNQRQLYSLDAVNEAIKLHKLRNKEAKDNYKKKINNLANIQRGTFNNFEQRTYDFDSLEKKLLGWDK